MPPLSDDKKIELLTDHYKDTFVHLTEYRKLRDRLFSLILLTITLLLFQIYSPTEAGAAIGQFIAKKLELQNAINISFIGSIIWFALLGFVIRYFQTVIHIERQYDYIHNLEEQISNHYKGKAFTREGKSYLTNYPLFSNWTHILYTIAFPLLLMVVVIIKTANEIYFSTNISFLLAFNFITALCVLISTVLYWRAIYSRK